VGLADSRLFVTRQAQAMRKVASPLLLHRAVMHTLLQVSTSAQMRTVSKVILSARKGTITNLQLNLFLTNFYGKDVWTKIVRIVTLKYNCVMRLAAKRQAQAIRMRQIPTTSAKCYMCLTFAATHQVGCCQKHTSVCIGCSDLQSCPICEDMTNNDMNEDDPAPPVKPAD
jgi:hypothetical protein